MEQLFFTAGLPRSGSTLLQNILNQNPTIHATGTSGLSALLVAMRRLWDQVPENATEDWDNSEARKKQVLQSVLNGFYNNVTKSVVIDKSRSWPFLIELLEELLGAQVKVLVTVRDMREILASWELLQRKHPLINKQIFDQNPVQSQTQAGRLQIYTSANHPIGSAYNRIQDAIHRGYTDRLHFVHFEKLTTQPRTILSGIYEFLGLPQFEHDFTNIEQTVFENDRVWGYPDLHTIRPILTPVKSKWREVLGEDAKNLYINWDKLT